MLAVGVGDQPEMPQNPSQPGWVQPTSRFDQDRFGLDGDPVGEVLSAVGHHRGVGDRQLPVRQRGRGPGQWAAEQGPGGPDRALGGAGAQAEPVPKPGGGRPGLLVLVGPGGAAASTAASSLSQWPSSRSTSRRRVRTRSANATSFKPSRSWVASSFIAAARVASPPGRRPSCGDECVFESMAATYQPPTQTQLPIPSCGKHGRRAGYPGTEACWTADELMVRPTVPGECMGPEPAPTYWPRRAGQSNRQRKPRYST